MREIEYYLSRRDYLEFFVIACARRIWKLGLAVAVLLTLIETWHAYCRCGYVTPQNVLANFIWACGFSAVVCFAVLLLNALYARQLHAGLEPLAKGQTISWDDESIFVGSDFFKAAYPWSLFKTPLETKRVIAAYLTPVMSLLFPKRFMSDQELSDLRQKLKSGAS